MKGSPPEAGGPLASNPAWSNPEPSGIDHAGFVFWTGDLSHIEVTVAKALLRFGCLLLWRRVLRAQPPETHGIRDGNVREGRGRDGIHDELRRGRPEPEFGGASAHGGRLQAGPGRRQRP